MAPNRRQFMFFPISQLSLLVPDHHLIALNDKPFLWSVTERLENVQPFYSSLHLRRKTFKHSKFRFLAPFSNSHEYAPVSKRLADFLNV